MIQQEGGFKRVRSREIDACSVKEEKGKSEPNSLMYTQRRESSIPPPLNRRIKYTTAGREAAIARPPEDGSRGDGGRSEAEGFGFAPQELWVRRA